jgi:hypothetical protein
VATKLQETTERLFQQLAGVPLADWIADQRAAGKSWRQLERDLRLEYDLELTNVTLISWYGDVDASVA